MHLQLKNDYFVFVLVVLLLLFVVNIVPVIGTTIAGVVCRNGIVLAADTRSTGGSIVADKNCEKIHYIAPRIYCCGAGTAADTNQLTRKVRSKLALEQESTSYFISENYKINPFMESRVITAGSIIRRLMSLNKQVSSAFVLGGVDIDGPHLFQITQCGTMDKVNYTTLGSGSIAAMGILETQYQPDIDLEEGMKLLYNAISAGIYNDLGSGSNVDMCIITKENTHYLRNYATGNFFGKKFALNNKFSINQKTTINELRKKE